jgi:hypothetical protein
MTSLPMTILLANLLFTGVVTGQSHPPGERSSSMQTIQQRVAKHLAAFKENHNPDDLAEATDLLDTLQPETSASPAQRQRFRTEKLQLELGLLGQIDSSLDPTFNFNSPPSLNVSPPPETGLPSGVDPASIADPRLRAEYEQEIKANQQKTQKYAFQMKLHQLDRRVTAQIETHLAITYSTNPDDFMELDKLIDDSYITVIHRAMLKRFVRTPHKS